MGFSYSQKVALAVLPKISGVFSIFGSMWIIIEVATNGSKRRVPYHRLLLAMSAYDVLESSSSFFSTWAIPKGSPNIIWAQGNDATCTVQGFLLQLTLAVPLYNAMLSIYYVLVINYRYTDAKLRSFAEPAMHLFCFLWPFGTGMYSILTKQINNANLWCWLAPLPAGCLNSWEHGTAEEGNPNPCIRGDNIWAYRFGFYFIPLWISIFTATVCTYMVYKFVHRQDKASLQYRKPERKSADNWSMSITGSGDAKAAAEVATRVCGQDEDLDDDDEKNSEKGGEGQDVSDQPETETTPEDEGSGLVEQLEASTSKGSIQGVSEGSGSREPTGAWSISMQEGKKRGTSNDGEGSSITPLPKAKNDEEDSVDNPAADNSAPQEAKQKAQFLRGHSVKQRWSTWREKRVKYSQDMPHAMEVLHQACLFLGVFYCTHLWSTSNRILQAITGGGSVFPILVLHAFFDPFQGFLNFFVYQYPRYKKLRKRDPDASRASILGMLFQFSFMGGNRRSTMSSYSQSNASRRNIRSSLYRNSSEKKSEVPTPNEAE